MRAHTAVIGLVLAVAAVLAPVAESARSHTFTGNYTGTGSGHMNRTGASGTATATGRGTAIGRSTLTGAATGIFTSSSCLAFRGNAVLRGRAGTIKLAARGARVCIPSTGSANVRFSGTVRVTGGTATFAGASGTLSYRGRYTDQTGVVTITFKGHITY